MNERCCFCGETNLQTIYTDQYHPLKPDYGPFNLLKCEACRSILTLPVPSSEVLTAFYSEFEDWRPAAYKRNRELGCHMIWYAHCVDRLANFARLHASDTFTWIDVGAGNGEMCIEMSRRFPNSTGIGADTVAMPGLLSGEYRVSWIQTDLNKSGFAKSIGRKADVVFANFVLEHVKSPANFVRELIDLLNPGGGLFVTAPDFSSTSSRILGRRWPMIIPGEHLNMPSRRGMRALLSRHAKSERDQERVRVRPIRLNYSVRYVLEGLGMTTLGRLLPPRFALPIPVGYLEAGLQPRKSIVGD